MYVIFVKGNPVTTPLLELAKSIVQHNGTEDEVILRMLKGKPVIYGSPKTLIENYGEDHPVFARWSDRLGLHYGTYVAGQIDNKYYYEEASSFVEVYKMGNVIEIHRNSLPKEIKESDFTQIGECYKALLDVRNKLNEVFQ